MNNNYLNATIEVDSSRIVTAASKDVEDLKKSVDEIRRILIGQQNSITSALASTLCFHSSVVESLSADRAYIPDWVKDGYVSQQERSLTSAPKLHIGQIASNGGVDDVPSSAYTELFDGEFMIVVAPDYIIREVRQTSPDGSLFSYRKIDNSIFDGPQGWSYQVNISRKDGAAISESELSDMILRAYSVNIL